MSTTFDPAKLARLQAQAGSLRTGQSLPLAPRGFFLRVLDAGGHGAPARWPGVRCETV